MADNRNLGMTNGVAPSTEKLDKVGSCVLWSNIETFQCLCLPVYPCAKLTIQKLEEVMVYLRERQQYCFPSMNMANWMSICHYQLELREEYAWMYIRLFDVVRQHMCRNDDEFSYWDKRCDRLCITKEDRFNELSVPTLEFLLFLYIQHSFINKAISSAEGIKHNVLGELSQFSYLMKYHMHDIMDFLQLSDKSTARVSLNIVSALNMIFHGAMCRKEGATLLKLEEFLAAPDVSRSLNFDPVLKTVDRDSFMRWTSLKFRINPFGTNRSLKKHQSQTGKTGTWKSDACSNPMNQIGGNIQHPQQEWVIITDLNKEVLRKDDFTPFINLKINRCNNSYIYVPAVFSNVVIEKCHNTTVYLGCVSKILRFVDCNRCYFIGQGRQVVIHDCVTSELNLHTPCQIIMTGLHNSDLVFGPYATFYPKLSEHMVMARLGVEPSHWDNIVGTAGPDGRSLVTDHCWTHLSPEEFFEFEYPFEMEGDTKFNPIKLPTEFTQNYNKMRGGFHLWRKHMESATMDTGSLDLDHETLYELFQFYLKWNMYHFELDGLGSLVPQNLDTENSTGEDNGEETQNSACEETQETTSSEESERSVCQLRNGQSLESLSLAVTTSVTSEMSGLYENDTVSCPLIAEFDASGSGIDDDRLDSSSGRENSVNMPDST